MRRAAVTGFALAALAAGCGGGSDRSGPDRPGTIQPAPQGPAAAVSPSVTDGRLGEAVVARPGRTVVRGHVRKLPPPRALPRSPKTGVGAEASCQDADLQATAANLARMSEAVFCLMNAMRANAGLPALKKNDLLARASTAHSEDMVQNSYFAHDGRDGRDLVARLKAIAYIPVDAAWIVGENLVWGSGGLSTPSSLVQAWMDSKPHRENLLSGDFAEVGMGPAFGTPSENAPEGVTFTTDFGTRFTDALTGSSADVASAGEASPASTASRTRAARRRAAMRKCSKRRGAAKRRCVRAARRVR